MNRAHLASMLALGLSACRSSPPEPGAQPAAEAASRAPSTHVIVQADHRGLTKLVVGDFVELPHDPLFAWTIKFENASYFDDASPSDAGIPRYRASRTGIVRTLVSGEPKECVGSDAACTVASYAWQVTLQVD